MRGIFTFKQVIKTSFFVLAAVGSLTADSQQQQVCNLAGTCPPVNYDFNDIEVGDTRSFTGDFTYSGPQSDNANSSRALETTTPLTSPKKLTTPGFPIPPGVVQIEYTFLLAGSGTVTSFQVFLITNAQPEGSLICSGVPVYSGGSAKVCGILPVFPYASQTVKLRFEFQVTANGSIENKTITFDDFGLYSGNTAITLPVKIHSLSARKVAAGTQVSWNVGEETNVSHYEIQRGTNSADFSTVGIHFAAGNASYSFVDTKPAQGVVFYRIKSIDTDRTFHYSTIISFSNGKAMGILRAYPMPVRNSITVQHALVESKAQISISTQDGKLVKMVTPATGSMETPIDLSALKAGMYLLRFTDGSGLVETLKLVKQ